MAPSLVVYLNPSGGAPVVELVVGQKQFAQFAVDFSHPDTLTSYRVLDDHAPGDPPTGTLPPANECIGGFLEWWLKYRVLAPQPNQPYHAALTVWQDGSACRDSPFVHNTGDDLDGVRIDFKPRQ